MNQKVYLSLKRQFVLLAAAQGMIFWYAIEKLFYFDVGLALSQIVLLGLIAQGSKIVFELPTSIYADRWSRKATLMFASGMMIASSLIIGLSSGFFVFVVGILFWSLSDALRSGVYESFAYDSLQQHGLQGRFRKVHTRMAVTELLTSTVAGLLAGVIGHFIDLRINFILSVIPMIGALTLLLRMKEPPLVRTSDTGESWIQHIGGSIKIIHRKQIGWVVVLCSALMGYTFMWYEYDQLVGIDVALPKAWFGVLMASLALGMAMGAELAHRKVGTKRWLVVSWLVLMLSIFAGLRAGSTVVAIGNIFVLFAAMRILRVYMEVYLHDHIPSNRRATIMSLSGSFSYVWFFAFAGIFTVTLPRFGVRPSFIIMSLPLLALCVIDIAKGPNWATNKKAPLDLEGRDNIIN